jgi:hypothetical protein
MLEWIQSFQGMLSMSIGGMTLTAIGIQVYTAIKNIRTQELFKYF